MRDDDLRTSSDSTHTHLNHPIRGTDSKAAARLSRGETSPPDHIGAYAIQRPLGRGGMGDVFLAHDSALSRQIALKRIRPDRHGNETVRQRFEIEARVTGALQHPSIVPVYDFVEQGDHSFYTMRPIEGITLSQLLVQLQTNHRNARDEWSTARLVRIFLQVASAVAYAHSHGVIHRDLKPSNIMIGPFEEVLVLDWGMAKLVNESTDVSLDTDFDRLRNLTESSVSDRIMGTPAYMAPEQFAGAASFSSDVFSLGVILYELLALRPPWRADTRSQLLDRMRTPPEYPATVQPGRNIPLELGRVVLKALEFEPRDRFMSVSRFSREVAAALEGKASWRDDSFSQGEENWRIAGGRLTPEGAEIVLRSRGEKGLFRYFCLRPYSGNVRVEFDLKVQKGSHELSLWLNTAQPRSLRPEVGYSFEILPGKRRTLHLHRSGRVVAGTSAPRLEPRRWHRCVVAREEERFSLRMAGQEIYVYHDPIPLTGGFVGLTGHSDGVRLRNLRVQTLGASATVSCLAIPDAFFNRGLYEEARQEYVRIAATHPGRNEGRLAAFRGGLCLLEMARQEIDPDTRGFLLEEAETAFGDSQKGTNTSCLLSMGHAMVAELRQQWAGKSRALAAAFVDHPEDPHLAALHEWLLGSLHALGSGNRQAIAHVLPLAISHCMGDYWGRRVVREIVKEVRREWEIPSFMTGRSLFKERDPVSHAEAKLFFGFWTDRVEIIESTLKELIRTQRVRPHHVADVIYALLELGHQEAAFTLAEEVSGMLQAPAGSKTARVLTLCRAAILASLGQHQEAASLAILDQADTSDRIFNSARLWLARALFEEGNHARALELMHPMGPHDGFAREHLTWFYLHLGDVKRAEPLLQPFLERSDHRTGRNLANFLYGTCLILRGYEEQAMRIFGCLETARWPRTWTLGPHYALGRLGGGDLDVYLEEAFPWEKTNLERQIQLLDQARSLASQRS